MKRPIWRLATDGLVAGVLGVDLSKIFCCSSNPVSKFVVWDG